MGTNDWYTPRNFNLCSQNYENTFKQQFTKLQRRIQDCCNIQDGALCDNSQQLPAVNYYYKALHLGCCSSPRSAAELTSQFYQFILIYAIKKFLFLSSQAIVSCFVIFFLVLSFSVNFISIFCIFSYIVLLIFNHVFTPCFGWCNSWSWLCAFYFRFNLKVGIKPITTKKRNMKATVFYPLQNQRSTKQVFLFKVGLSHLRKFLPNFFLKFSPALFEKIPSFVCLVFKIENK